MDKVEMRRWGSDSGNVLVKEEEEEEEESLSLCDLPISEEKRSRKESSSISKPTINESQEEFNFCDFVISKESEMCAADEVFFQGQILPLRHSVSCDGGLSSNLQSEIRNASKCISRSDSMDRCYSGGLTSASSRSSSINSHHSSSSGSSSSAATTTTTNSKHKKPRPPRVPDHFQYSHHPSPKPQVRSSTIKNNSSNTTNSNRNSGLWSLLRVGLMTPPEIALRDLKNRNNSLKTIPHQSFGSRNSTNSNISTSTNSNISSRIISAKRKQPFFLNKNGVFFGGCKCTASSVGPNPSRIATGKEEVNTQESRKQHAMKMTKHQTAGRQALSRHRTFEWLKQLSLQQAAMDQT